MPWSVCVCVQVSYNAISFAVTMIVSEILLHFNPLVVQIHQQARFFR